MPEYPSFNIHTRIYKTMWFRYFFVIKSESTEAFYLNLLFLLGLKINFDMPTSYPYQIIINQTVIAHQPLMDIIVLVQILDKSKDTNLCIIMWAVFHILLVEHWKNKRRVVFSHFFKPLQGAINTIPISDCFSLYLT